MKKTSTCFLFQGSGTRDNFNKFPGDHGLTGPVECESEFVNHLSSVLGGVVHSRHTRRLFGAGTFLQGVEEHGGEGELHVGLDHVSVQ